MRACCCPAEAEFESALLLQLRAEDKAEGTVMDDPSNKYMSSERARLNMRQDCSCTKLNHVYYTVGAKSSKGSSTVDLLIRSAIGRCSLSLRPPLMPARVCPFRSCPAMSFT